MALGGDGGEGGRDMTERVDLREAWNQISSHYQAHSRIPTDFVHYGPHCPNEDQLHLIGEVRGKWVLEIGCGGGQCSIAFAKRGAIVTGVDLSDEQIAFAGKLAEAEGVAVTFLRRSMEDLSPIADHSQDVVFSAYALQYLEMWDRCLAEVRRVLAPDGLLVFSVDHPFFACMAGDSFRINQSYHGTSRETWNWEYPDAGVSAPFEAWHRKVSVMFRSLRDAGFQVLDTLEPEPVESGSGQDTFGDYYSPARQRMVPATIIWKATHSGCGSPVLGAIKDQGKRRPKDRAPARQTALRRKWNRISPFYQAEHDIPTDFVHYGPHCPNEDQLQLIGDVRGKRVLEVGCGGGQCSIAFAKRGAVVTGIDLSDNQIEFARELAARNGVVVSFLQGDAQDLSAIPDASQEIVFSAYALQFVEHMDRCFSEVARVLRPGGLFVFSLDHPFWYCLPDGELVVESSYFDSAYWYEWEQDGLSAHPRMTEYHRTIGEWHRLLCAAGFEVLDMVEPEPVEVGSGQDWGGCYAPERQRMVPATIIWKARKL
jgi:ubiquinone/menaquinone biosynthesis C-methylase UbiE